MKCFTLLLLTIMFVLPSCDMSKRERELSEKEAQLNQKEQELLLREQSAQIKEDELLAKEKLDDSSSTKRMPDTLTALYPAIPGRYNVVMRCTETTCAGSAVGDTKTEQWDISFESNRVIAKAMSDKKLTRVYSGNYVGKLIELTAQHDNATIKQPGEIIVRLQETKDNRLEGQREIIRPEDCRTIYDLQLQKQ